MSKKKSNLDKAIEEVKWVSDNEKHYQLYVHEGKHAFHYLKFYEDTDVFSGTPIGERCHQQEDADKICIILDALCNTSALAYTYYLEGKGLL